MAETGERVRRKNRMKVRDAQAEMLTLLPDLEVLAERFQAIDENLEPHEPSDRLVFGRPSRESLRYSVAGSANRVFALLLEALREIRSGGAETHANLMAEWEAEQEREAEREPNSWIFGPRYIGS